MNSIPKHKVFISYYHKNHQKYKDWLINLRIDGNQNNNGTIFLDHSVREKDIDDNVLDPKAVRTIIRKKYIKDASVLILLCGEGTKTRKFIDWELQAAMYKDNENKPLGIIVINVPPLHKVCSILSADIEDSKIIKNSIKWSKLKTKEDIINYFPYLPDRIVDNILRFTQKDSYYPLSIVNWKTIKKNPLLLKTLVDNAHKRLLKGNKHYDISRPIKNSNN